MGADQFRQNTKETFCPHKMDLDKWWLVLPAYHGKNKTWTPYNLAKKHTGLMLPLLGLTKENNSNTQTLTERELN